MNVIRKIKKVRRSLKRISKNIRRAIGYKTYRRIQLSIYLAIFVLAVLFMMPSTKVKADEGNDPVSYKYFQTISVDYGDTLWSIAAEYCNDSDYNSYIKEVKSINKLKNNNIKAGQTLVVPYYSNEYYL